MAAQVDGATHLDFASRALRGNVAWADFGNMGLSQAILNASQYAPRGECVFRGLPFRIGARPVVVREGSRARKVSLPGCRAQWLVFAHVSDVSPGGQDAHGFTRHSTGEGHLAEPAADYVMVYADGTEERVTVRRRHQLGAVQPRWGENCVEAVAHTKPAPIRQEQQSAAVWGWTQRRVSTNDRPRWTNWLWAWENPHPRKAIVAGDDNRHAWIDVAASAIHHCTAWRSASLTPKVAR